MIFRDRNHNPVIAMHPHWQRVNALYVGHSKKEKIIVGTTLKAV